LIFFQLKIGTPDNLAMEKIHTKFVYFYTLLFFIYKSVYRRDEQTDRRMCKTRHGLISTAA